MTFSILGICARTGCMGFAQATSTPAVGWRCTDVVPHRGIITVQAHGDYRLRRPARRLCLTADRRISFAGSRTVPWSGSAESDDHIAIGNVLVGSEVVTAMSEAFIANAALGLPDRLMLALEAGRDAGGQPDTQVSSTLAVHDHYDFPIVNLRVDISLEPAGEMRRNFDWFKALIPYYIKHTLDRSSVPRYKQVLRDSNLPLNPF